MAIIPEKYTTLSPIQEEYRKFWLYFNSQSLNHRGFSSTFKIHPTPSIRCYQDFSIRQPYHLVLKVDFKRNQYVVMIYFNKVKVYIDYYENHKTRIESELGYTLEWKELATKGSAGKMFAANLFDNSQYEQICQKMMDEGIRIVRIFNSYTEELIL